MIQRVQSLLLLAVSILMIIFLFVPIWRKEASHTNDSLSSLGARDRAVLKPFYVSYSRFETAQSGTMVEKRMAKESTWYIGVLAILAAAIALFSIFQYRNRMRQIQLGLLNALIMSGVLGSIFLGMKEGDKLVPGQASEDFSIGFFIPAIALLLNIGANRFIKKDENLVRSADRIR